MNSCRFADNFKSAFFLANPKKWKYCEQESFLTKVPIKLNHYLKNMNDLVASEDGRGNGKKLITHSDVLVDVMKFLTSRKEILDCQLTSRSWNRVVRGKFVCFSLFWVSPNDQLFGELSILEKAFAETSFAKQSFVQRKNIKTPCKKIEW